MSASIGVSELRVGMFVHLDLAWWAHPFALSTFKITSADQIATIRGLGLDRVRWSPEKSSLDTEDAAADADGLTPAAEAEVGAVTPEAAAPSLEALIESVDQRRQREQREQLAAQREAGRVCTRQYNEAARAWKAAAEQAATHPESAREAIRVLCSAHGASSFAEASPMQRIWRDSEIASRHAVVAPEISALIYGRALMGFTEGVSFLV